MLLVVNPASSGVATPVLADIFNLTTNQSALLVAAIFGLVPSQLFSGPAAPGRPLPGRPREERARGRIHAQHTGRVTARTRFASGGGVAFDGRRAPAREVRHGHRRDGTAAGRGVRDGPDARRSRGRSRARGAGEPGTPDRDPNTIGVVFVHGVGSQRPGEWLLEACRPFLRLIGAWRATTEGVEPGNDTTTTANIDFAGGSRPFVDRGGAGDRRSPGADVAHDRGLVGGPGEPAVGRADVQLARAVGAQASVPGASCPASGPRAGSSAWSTSSSCPCS